MGSEVDRLVEDGQARTIDHERGEWDHEFDGRLFDWAAQRVRGEVQAPTWEAFWRTASRASPIPCEVAAALGLSVGAVYVAKSRVLARLRTDGCPPVAEGPSAW